MSEKPETKPLDEEELNELEQLKKEKLSWEEIVENLRQMIDNLKEQLLTAEEERLKMQKEKDK